MSRPLLERIRGHAARDGRRVALESAGEGVTYEALPGRIEFLAGALAAGREAGDGGRIGLFADNGLGWALSDLAAGAAGLAVIPLPTFFSDPQLCHSVQAAGVRRIVTDRVERLGRALPLRRVRGLAGSAGLWEVEVERAAGRHDGPALPAGTAKISFTSGTTGTPKGVCLAAGALQRVVAALAEASAACHTDRHLCVLPLATLLENLAGLQVPLWAGATCCLAAPAAVGLAGSQGFDPARCLAALVEARASTTILVPQMLAALLGALANGPRPAELRYVAVGGAPLPRALLDRAAELGLPVYQGYGLTECASVVAVNRPEANRPGSVGRPLPHLRVEIAPDGEILLHGVVRSPYLGDPEPAAEGPFATGDLGYLDAAGHLYVTGRKKDLFITAFGRNVAPAWVEGELMLHAPPILQAAVFGEGRPFNVAVIFAAPGSPRERVDRALALANARLPDYARVQRWIAAREPFSVTNGLATGNGRPRREAIAEAYAAELLDCFDKETHGSLRFA